MKTIYLMRHAKSDWDADYSGDFNRPLNNRGKSSATKMGTHLVDFIVLPIWFCAPVHCVPGKPIHFCLQQLIGSQISSLMMSCISQHRCMSSSNFKI